MVFGAYHWSPESLDRRAAFEVFEHFGHIKQKEAFEKVWALSISVQPHRDEKGQKEVYRQAEDIGRAGNRRQRKSAYDVLRDQGDDDAAIRAIGTAWASGGKIWEKHNQHEIAWLESLGITKEEAAQRFEDWWNDRVAIADGEYVTSVGIGGNGQGIERVSRRDGAATTAGEIDLGSIDLDAPLNDPEMPDSARGEGEGI